MSERGGKLRRLYTAVAQKTINPVWEESFLLPLQGGSREHVVIHVWDWDMFTKNDFLGEIRLPWWEYKPNTLVDKWFTLTPHRTKDKRGNHLVTGKLHLQFCYYLHGQDYASRLGRLYGPPCELNALDYEGYKVNKDTHLCAELVIADDFVLTQALFKHLLQSNAHGSKAGLQLQQAVFSLFQRHTFKATLRLLALVIEDEIDRTTTNKQLFRSNSIATTLMGLFNTAVGEHYRRKLLKAGLKPLLNSRDEHEIDPLRLNNANERRLTLNQANLEAKCDVVLGAIEASVHANKVPAGLRILAHVIQKIIRQRRSSHEKIMEKGEATALADGRQPTFLAQTKADSDEAEYICLASLYFLRFLCPAIANPSAHGLVSFSFPALYYLAQRFLISSTQLLASSHEKIYPPMLSLFF